MSVLMRVCFVAIGLGATGMAALGVWLPGLPATPFILIALWAFGKSDNRLRAWMLQAPLFRDAVAHAERYRLERTIDWRIKLLAISVAWSSALITVLFRDAPPPWLMATLVLLAVACTVFMLLTKTTVKNVSGPAER